MSLFLESHREPAVGLGDRNYFFITICALFIEVVISFEDVVEVWWVEHTLYHIICCELLSIKIRQLLNECMLVNLVKNLPINDLLQCFNFDLILFSFGIQVIHDHLGERTLSPVQFVDEKSLNCSVKLLLNMSLQSFFVVILFSQQFVNFMVEERCCVVVLVQLLLQLTFNIFVQDVVLVGWKKVSY